MIVTNLTARTGCEGKAIYLAWENPAGATSVRVMRRANDWNFYSDDPADVVYEGTPVTTFADNADAAFAVKLAGDTYYYYTVLATDVGSPTPADYEVDALSRVSALSIDVMQGKEWIWRNMPVNMKNLDARPKQDGGGEGDLAKWNTVMGCWLNLMRGYNKAAILGGDDSKMHYEAAREKNRFWGVEPEDGYDFTVIRKFNQHAAHIGQTKSTCPSLVEVTQVYTGWDATCVDLADTVESECQGPTLLSTYDGKSSFKQILG